MRQRRRFAAAALMVTCACSPSAWQRVLSAGTCDSGNSSADSGDSSRSDGSSQGSGDSSRQTNGSLAASNESSKSSAESSASSRVEASENSTRASSGDTTDQTSPQQTTGPVLSTTTLGATVLALGALLWRAPRTPTELRDVAGAAYAYVRTNELELAQDLALGAGPSLEDLAAIAEIPPAHYPRFARLLQQRRADLLAWIAPGTLTPARAIAFLASVGDTARADTLLAADAAAFLERHAE